MRRYNLTHYSASPKYEAQKSRAFAECEILYFFQIVKERRENRMKKQKLVQSTSQLLSVIPKIQPLVKNQK